MDLNDSRATASAARLLADTSAGSGALALSAAGAFPIAACTAFAAASASIACLLSGFFLPGDGDDEGEVAVDGDADEADEAGAGAHEAHEAGAGAPGTRGASIVELMRGGGGGGRGGGRGGGGPRGLIARTARHAASFARVAIPCRALCSLSPRSLDCAAASAGAPKPPPACVSSRRCA